MFNVDLNITPEKILNISKQIRAGVQYENPTVELKRSFWDISTDIGKNEFAKDLCTMANSKFGAGNIIVGIDGKTGDLHDIKLPKDVADLANIINRKVLEPFNIEFKEVQVDEKNIIIIHIPYSYNKPHILRMNKEREMFIPIRKGTRTLSADKYDLDAMYSERDKIVVPPYQLDIFYNTDELFIRGNASDGAYFLSCIVNILNTGSRMNLVEGGTMKIFKEEQEIVNLKLFKFFNTNNNEGWKDIKKNHFIKILQNDVERINLGFYIKKRTQYDEIFNSSSSLSAQISLSDFKGNICFTKIIKLID